MVAWEPVSPNIFGYFTQTVKTVNSMHINACVGFPSAIAMDGVGFVPQI